MRDNPSISSTLGDAVLSCLYRLGAPDAPNICAESMSELTETMDTEFLFPVRPISVEQHRADLVQAARKNGAAPRTVGLDLPPSGRKLFS